MSRVRVAKKTSRSEREKNPVSVFSIGSVIIAVICLLIVIVGRSVVQQRNLSPEESTPSRVWKLPPPPRKLGVSNLPGTPHLGEVLKSQSTNAAAGYELESLSLKVKALIQNHPLTIISDGLHERLKAGTIFLNWQVAQGLYAQFQVITSGQTRMLVLSFDPKWLASVKTPDQIYLAYLVILHEYVHVRQYEQGNEKVKLYFVSARIPESQMKITKEDVCVMMWTTESDAYTQECRVANQWGYALMETFCLYVDSVSWSQVIFRRLYQDAYLDEKVKRVCGPIFAKLAGHPHPELF